MVVILAALLAGKTVLPHIDRETLDIQARAEMFQPRSSHRPALRRASVAAFDLSQITTICRAAGNQPYPLTFLARVSAAYSLSSEDMSALRSSCSSYLSGHADARRGR